MRETRPVRDGLFRDGGRGPVLIGGSCVTCRRPHFPRAELCPYCSAEGCAERELRGSGRLWLYTAVATAPPGYRGPLPFGFGVVELDDGLRVISRLGESDLARLRPGMPMRLVIDQLYVDDDGCGVLSYAFSPIG
jgi:uncharacterized OB-fold protein